MSFNTWLVRHIFYESGNLLESIHQILLFGIVSDPMSYSFVQINVIRGAFRYGCCGYYITSVGYYIDYIIEKSTINVVELINISV